MICTGNSGDTRIVFFSLVRFVLINHVYPKFQLLLANKSSDGRKIVHGDLRDVNIMLNFEHCKTVWKDHDLYKQLIKTEGKSVDWNEIENNIEKLPTEIKEEIAKGIRIIDYDWCGYENEARYPQNINEDAFKCLKKVTSDSLQGARITTLHDVTMLESLFDK